MNKTPRNILIWVLVSTCLLDIITFLYAGIKYDLFDYEINPLIVMLKLNIGIWLSITITILWKLIINAGLIWALIKYKPNKSHFFAYFLIYGTLFALILQGIGAYSNMYMTHLVVTTPVGESIGTPLTTEQSINLSNIITMVYYFFLCFSMLSFWIYEKIYRNISKHGKL